MKPVIPLKTTNLDIDGVSSGLILSWREDEKDSNLSLNNKGIELYDVIDNCTQYKNKISGEEYLESLRTKRKGRMELKKELEVRSDVEKENNIYMGAFEKEEITVEEGIAVNRSSRDNEGEAVIDSREQIAGEVEEVPQAIGNVSKQTEKGEAESRLITQSEIEGEESSERECSTEIITNNIPHNNYLEIKSTHEDLPPQSELLFPTMLHNDEKTIQKEEIIENGENIINGEHIVNGEKIGKEGFIENRKNIEALPIENIVNEESKENGENIENEEFIEKRENIEILPIENGENIENEEFIENRENIEILPIENGENIENEEFIENRENIEALPIENIENEEFIENRENIEALPIENIENEEFIENRENIEILPIENIVNEEIKENGENIENEEFIKNIENIENGENIENEEFIENRENIEALPIENIENEEFIENRENIEALPIENIENEEFIENRENIEILPIENIVNEEIKENGENIENEEFIKNIENIEALPIKNIVNEEIKENGENIENEEFIEKIENIENGENIENEEFIEKIENIENGENIENEEFIEKRENIENGENIENEEFIEKRENIENGENIENEEFIEKRENIENGENIENEEFIEKRENIENGENIENEEFIEKRENIENGENIENEEFIEKRENIEALPIEDIENVDDVEVLHIEEIINSEYRENDDNVCDIDNIENIVKEDSIIEDKDERIKEEIIIQDIKMKDRIERIKKFEEGAVIMIKKRFKINKNFHWLQDPAPLAFKQETPHPITQEEKPESIHDYPQTLHTEYLEPTPPIQSSHHPLTRINIANKDILEQEPHCPIIYDKLDPQVDTRKELREDIQPLPLRSKKKIKRIRILAGNSSERTNKTLDHRLSKKHLGKYHKHLLAKSSTFKANSKTKIRNSYSVKKDRDYKRNTFSSSFLFDNLDKHQKKRNEHRPDAQIEYSQSFAELQGYVKLITDNEGKNERRINHYQNNIPNTRIESIKELGKVKSKKKLIAGTGRLKYTTEEPHQEANFNSPPKSKKRIHTEHDGNLSKIKHHSNSKELRRELKSRTLKKNKSYSGLPKYERGYLNEKEGTHMPMISQKNQLSNTITYYEQNNNYGHSSESNNNQPKLPTIGVTSKRQINDMLINSFSSNIFDR